ncbi:hypothetical protein ACHAPJ_009048 [Fusarium lateritium]
MREVMEDVYIGLEHKIGQDVAAEAIKLSTRTAATKVARFSFEYARKHNRKRVTCLQKAKVLNHTDGLCLSCFQEVSKEYVDTEADDMTINVAWYAIIRNPQRCDVIVTSNQYGDIFSDLAAGLVGVLFALGKTPLKFFRLIVP